MDGQIEQLRAELAGPAPGDVKEQSQGKEVLDKASAMEEAAESGDEAAMEKEVAEGSQDKDETENVVDGAMAYIRTRLAKEEHKTLRLRQLLSQSVKGNRKMREKIEELRKQVTDEAATQRSISSVSEAKFAQEEAQLTDERQRWNLAEKRLANATRAAKIG